MGVHARENLEMADGFFQNDETNVRKVISVIRNISLKLFCATRLKTGILIMAEF